MKVLLIHNYYQFWGGEDTYVTSLQKLLTDNGHKVYLYTKDSKNIRTFWDKIRTALNLFWNPKMATELNKLILNVKPDVAHFNNVYPLIGATAYWICKKNKIKIVQTIHNYRFMCPKGILFRNGKICELCINKHIFSPAIRFGCYHKSRLASLFYSISFFFHKSMGIFSHIDTYLFPSQFTQRYYQQHFDISKSKSVYLPYFIDLKKTNSKIKRGSYQLFIGRLSEEKGIIDLLETYKKMPTKELKVIGTGPLQKEVNQYKKYKNIKILGFMTKKKFLPILQKAKSLIVPSKWYEVSPIVILEAIATNTPIVTKKHLEPKFIRSHLTKDFHLIQLLKYYN